MNITEVTILDTEQISTSFRSNSFDGLGLIMPAAFDGTTITFMGSNDNSVTFYDIYDSSGVQISATVGLSRCVSLSDILFDLKNFQFVKIKAGTIQTGDRTIKVVG